ncbi:hypothetical protein P691DRAFT_557479 [Macrolepiota fuliginosa MF-IS2]|uniref:BZIP domain-containing protein n=1 Tax=Macrolepiota fuliginosa MF-IS2 TaxID=1400762 RepID=A0A9P5XQD0_9AGAR|nr:hypothetical protein P691DRAFT_557479 [Macrolepiota fuliginosa MF-IS2]
MPKSPRSSPSSTNPKSAIDDAGLHLTDIALRKKKNADAQAAFRARRANYIATLEETVTSLESVVLQLQESWRESRAELQDARQEILRLQHQYRERDRFWRDLWENRRTGPTQDTDDIASSSPSFSPLHTQPSTLGSQMGNPQLAQYPLDSMAYRPSDETPTPQPAYNGQQDFPTTGANSLSYHEGDVSGDGPHCLGQRVEKITYIPRFPNDDSKLALGNFEAASFTFNGDRFPESRSLSPTSTPSSSSSTSIPSTSYPYTFPDPALTQDVFRRPSHNAEMTLHGGTADISVMPGTDAVRYRLGSRQSISVPDRPVLPLTPRPASANESQHERGSSDVAPALSCTVAVIKAQAFGALRRTRTRTKKSTETAARVAHDVLEARGIGLGHRRRGSQDDDLDSNHQAQEY